MTTEAPTPTEAPTEEPTTPEPSGFTAPATQAEFDAMVKDRLKREATKYADYSDLKAKATEFDKIADAQKTEIQRAQERAEAAEAALAQTQSESLRLSVIAKHSIPADYQEFVSGATEDELEAKAQKVLGLIPANPTGFVRPDLSQGTKTAAPSNDPAQAFAQALNSARGR